MSGVIIPVAVSVLLFGCSVAKPIARVEYGRLDAAAVSEYAYAQAGIRGELGEFTGDLMAGPVVSATDGEEQTGLNLNPRWFWWFSEDGFLQVEIDYSIIEGESSSFLFFSVEKSW